MQSAGLTQADSRGHPSSDSGIAHRPPTSLQPQKHLEGYSPRRAARAPSTVTGESSPPSSSVTPETV